MTPKTGFINYSTKLPKLIWSGMTDDNLKEIQVKINDGEYKTLGILDKSEAMLPQSDFPKDGKYTIKVRAIDKAGNVSEENTCNYYYETSDYELSKYTPIDVFAVEQIGENSMYSYSSVSTPNGSGQIELSKGNLCYEQEDISLPAVSIPVKIARYYNSKSDIKSSFGYGWNCEYDSYISECSDKIYYSEGTQAVYTFEKKDNKYECIENADMLLEIDDDVINKTIEKTSGEKESLEIDVHYKVTDKNGEIYRFDDAGRLALIEEANENFVCISYNDKDGKIKSVSTNKGQEANFEYNEEGLISKITAADKAYGYSYTYSNAYLTKATYIGTDGKTINYKYSYEDGLLTTISDAKGNDYIIDYNLDGAIVKFTKPNGEYSSYKYNYMKPESRPETVASSYNGLNSEENSSSVTYNFAADGRITEKKDETGNIATYEYNKEKKSLLTKTTEKSYFYALENNVVVKKTLNDKENTEYYPNGNVKSETDSTGNVTTYEYNDTRSDYTKNQPTKSVTKDPNGNVTSNKEYEYDEKGNILKETDWVENKITKYEYGNDGSGLVNKITEALVENPNNETNGIKVSEENVEYNNVGDEKKENTEEGTVEEKIEYTYDKYGNVIKEEDLKTGNITQYEYDSFFRTNKIIETKVEKGKTTVKTTQNKYDENGNLVENIDECGRKTTYTYDLLNRVKTTTLKVGNDTKITNNTYTYGSVAVYNGITSNTIDNAFITTICNEKGEELSKTYVDGKGRTVRELSNGLYNDYTYDSQGKVLSTYVSGVNQEDVSKNVVGKLIVTTYDAKGNQTATITNPKTSGSSYEVGQNSIVTKNEYDVNGNIIKSIDAEGNATLYEYDNQGRVMKVTTPEGNYNSYNYDNMVNDADLISLNGVIDNKVVESTVTDAKGNVSKTIDNGAGQILKILDTGSQSGTSTATISKVYEYDNNGQKTKEIYSDGSFIENEYEATTGYLLKKSKVDKNGNCESYTTYTYNSEGSVESAIDYKGGKAYRYTYYGYDGYGRNISVAEINSTVTPSSDTIEAAKVKYVYNVDNNIEKIYYPNNAKDKIKGIKFIYNKDKWITEIDALFANDETTPIRKYEYYNDSKIKFIKDYKNFKSKGTDFIQRDYIYDEFDRVTSMQYQLNTNLTEVLESYEYKYDKNSNIVYKHEKCNYSNSLKDEEITYSYDLDGRLVGSERENKLTYKTIRCTYKYDKVGNRTYESEFETDTVAADQSKTTGYYSYNSYNNLSQLTGSTVIECKDGLSVKSYSKSYKYDKKGNQISASDTGNGTVTSYEYDVENQLTDVKIEINNEVVGTQHNEYNGSGQRIRKTESRTIEGKTTETITNYYYEGSLLLYTTDESGNKTSQNIIGNQNNTIASIRYDGDMQKAFFYSKDIKGSTTVITNEKGKCEQSYSYTDYGETTIGLDTNFYNEICYTGGVYDELTGLYYLNARYYDSENGSFISQDTYRGKKTDENTWNLYGYCANNPINYVDPSGHYVVGFYALAQGAVIVGAHIKATIGFDGKNFLVMFSWGVGAQANISASASIGIFGNPWMKSVDNLKAIGEDSATASIAWTWGVRASVGVSFSYHDLFDKNYLGINGDVGFSDSLIPITIAVDWECDQYSKKISLNSTKKMKNGQSKKIENYHGTVKYTKRKNHIEFKAFRFKQKINFYYKKNKIKVSK